MTPKQNEHRTFVVHNDENAPSRTTGYIKGTKVDTRANSSFEQSSKQAATSSLKTDSSPGVKKAKQSPPATPPVNECAPWLGEDSLLKEKSRVVDKRKKPAGHDNTETESTLESGKAAPIDHSGVKTIELKQQQQQEEELPIIPEKARLAVSKEDKTLSDESDNEDGLASESQQTQDQIRSKHNVSKDKVHSDDSDTETGRHKNNSQTKKGPIEPNHDTIKEKVMAALESSMKTVGIKNESSSPPPKKEKPGSKTDATKSDNVPSTINSAVKNRGLKIKVPPKRVKVIPESKARRAKVVPASTSRGKFVQFNEEKNRSLPSGEKETTPHGSDDPAGSPINAGIETIEQMYEEFPM